MNLGTAKTKALQLINEYSNNGALTTDADYTLRMNNLADAAQKEIAAVKKILDIYPLTITSDDTNTLKRYLMPSNFMELKQVYKEKDLCYSLISLVWEGKTALIESSFDGKLNFHYYKYPTTITKDTLDTYEFEIDIEAQELIPFYIAGHLYLDDNPLVWKELLKQYERKLYSLKNNESPVQNRVINTYDMGW